MKSFIIVAILLAISLVNASPLEVCEDPESENSYNVGQAWDMKASCGKYFCDDSGFVIEQRCPWYQPRRGCHVLDGDRKKPFPKCCPHIACSSSGRITKPTY